MPQRSRGSVASRACVLIAALLAIGCASDDGDDKPGALAEAGGSGGMSVVAGSSAAGAGGSGGMAGVEMHVGAGGAANAGAGGSGGAKANSGGSGGTSNGSSGSGGSIADAGASTGGSDGGNTSEHVAVPSTGCSKTTGRPAGGVVAVEQSHYFTFPERYDGKQPLPVLIGFHGCGAGNRGTSKDDTEWISYTKGSAFETDYVRMVPLSADAGGCWNYATDITRVTQMFDDLLANYCVDTSRVFATGHSSGAQFVVQILAQSHAADGAHFGFAAVAPVAASDYGAIAGPIAVMYIQGMMDHERGNGDGHETVDRFRSANGCDSTSIAYADVADCKSQGGGTTVNPGCKIYDSCEAPTIWCSHNDPFYSGTMHGIPCFAIEAMHEFFASQH